MEKQQIQRSDDRILRKIDFHIFAEAAHGKFVCCIPSCSTWFLADQEYLFLMVDTFSPCLKIIDHCQTDLTFHLQKCVANHSHVDETRDLYQRCLNHFRSFSLRTKRLSFRSLFRHPVISVTNKCNLRCSYCYIGTPSIERNQRANLRTELIIRFIDQIQELGKGSTKTVQFFGGEPLLHPQLSELMQYSLRIGLHVRVSTNGTSRRIMSKELRPFVKDKRVEWRVSLDSHLPELHERYRGLGTFKSILRNLHYLRNMGANVSIKLLLRKDTLDTFEGYLEFAHSMGFLVSYGVLLSLGEAAINQNIEKVTHLDVIEKILEIYQRKPHLVKLLLPSPFGRVIRSLFIIDDENFSRFYFYLHHDGKVYLNEEVVTEELCVGTPDLLDLPRARELQKELYLERPSCTSCPIDPFCYRGSYGELALTDATMRKEFNSCLKRRSLYARLMSLGDIAQSMAKIMYQ